MPSARANARQGKLYGSTIARPQDSTTAFIHILQLFKVNCYAEIEPIPKFAHDFIEKYQDRLVNGTDNMPDQTTYRLTFRILETADEHFYAHYLFSYHWPLYGLFLTDTNLKKLYRDNALKIMSSSSKASEDKK